MVWSQINIRNNTFHLMSHRKMKILSVIIGYLVILDFRGVQMKLTSLVQPSFDLV